MPTVIPQIVKDEVFQSWLSGSFRRQNATKHGVSEGTVSNVVTERKLQHGSDKLDLARALSIAMSRSGLSIGECAVGHRVAMIMRHMGADEGHFEVFIEKLCHLYVNAGLAPDNLVKEIEELHYFRETNQSLQGGVSIPQICENIKTKQAEEKKIHEAVVAQHVTMRDLKKETCEMQFQKATLETDMGLAKELKDKLEAEGIQPDDILKNVHLAVIVKRSGYSVQEAMERLSALSGLEDAAITMKNKIIHAGLKHDYLIKENASLEDHIHKNSQKIRELDFLKNKGFGLSELKQLHYLINEIEEHDERRVEQNGDAVKKFFDSLRDHYHEYCNLGKKVNELHSDIANINWARNYLSVSLNLTPEVNKTVELLVRKGIKKDELPDIVKKVVENHLPSTTTTLSNPTRMRYTSRDHSGPGIGDSESRFWPENSTESMAYTRSEWGTNINEEKVLAGGADDDEEYQTASHNFANQQTNENHTSYFEVNQPASTLNGCSLKINKPTGLENNAKSQTFPPTPLSVNSFFRFKGFVRRGWKRWKKRHVYHSPHLNKDEHAIHPHQRAKPYKYSESNRNNNPNALAPRSASYEISSPLDQVRALNKALSARKDCKPQASVQFRENSKLQGSAADKVCSDVQSSELNLGELVLNLHPDLLDRIKRQSNIDGINNNRIRNKFELRTAVRP